MTEHRKPSRSRSRSQSKSRSGSHSRSAYPDKHKRSKNKDVYSEDDDSSSEAQFTPSESSEEPSRHGRCRRSKPYWGPMYPKTDPIPPDTKSCCRDRVKQLRRMTANYRPQHIRDSIPEMYEAENELSGILYDNGVCRYHGKDGQRRKERDEKKERERNLKQKQRDKERRKHMHNTRPRKRKQPTTRRHSHRHVKHEDTESDDSFVSVYNKSHFRNDSRKVMGVFGDKNATENLYVFGKRYPAFATFHRLLYMAFKQVGVPKPVSLMPRREEAYWKKRAKRNRKL